MWFSSCRNRLHVEIYIIEVKQGTSLNRNDSNPDIECMIGIGGLRKPISANKLLFLVGNILHFFMMGNILRLF